jgi:hypothetical protein
MIFFRFTVATARASADLAGGIATIDTGNAVLVASGVAKGVALTTASGSVGSTSATIELRVPQSEENGAHPLVRARFWFQGSAAGP